MKRLFLGALSVGVLLSAITTAHADELQDRLLAIASRNCRSMGNPSMTCTTHNLMAANMFAKRIELQMLCGASSNSTCMEQLKEFDSGLEKIFPPPPKE
jgi:hypothetical protein